MNDPRSFSNVADQAGRRTVHSSCTSSLVVHILFLSTSVVGVRSFLVVNPQIGNSLPHDVTSAQFTPVDPQPAEKSSLY